MYSDTDLETEGLQGYNFTATDGWRILSRTRNALDSSKFDIEIISTGIPAKLFYYYNPSSSEEENNNWWGTTSQVNSTYGLNLSSWTSSKSGYYAAYGLVNNFSGINFDNGTSQSTANKGCWQSVAGKTSGTGVGFIASGFKTETINVHNLTLEELNTARGYTGLNLTNTKSTATEDGDTGLFYLRNLANENSKFGYTSNANPYYWLGRTYPDFTDSLYNIINTGIIGYGGNGSVENNSNFARGLRPVIEIKGVTMTQNKTTGLWTITQSTQ